MTLADILDTTPITAHRGELVDFCADPREPGVCRVPPVRHIEDGLLLVQDGRIKTIGIAEDLLPLLPPGVEVTDHRGKILMPGLIDAHIHYPQTDVIASHGKRLLDWLNDYTFPAEAAFADTDHAAAVAEFFLDELMRNGTTTAAVYPTLHKNSVDAFFSAAQKRGLRMLCGKVMMDRHCPEFLRDEAESSYADSAELIERWHGRDRLIYAVTPRFAATSSERQLELAGKLLDDYPGVRLQTHIAENSEEIRWVEELFPWSKNYLDVYDHFGLVRPGALFGHCIHFDDASWARMASSGATAVHCPTSNLFLGSGLFDYDRAHREGVPVAVATDVGGGTSFSMLRTLHEAYKVAQMGRRALDSLDAFYLATRGGAKALGLDKQIGSFDAGCEADFIVLDPDATPILSRRMAAAKTLEEKLFLLMMLGDDRAVAGTYVMGKKATKP
jgi:guanine deaminase